MFYVAEEDRLNASAAASTNLRPIATCAAALAPKALSRLHRNFQRWEQRGLSPGVITPDAVWCSIEGDLALMLSDGITPLPLTHVGMARELAAWFVLLDKWVETSVVVAQAREVWTIEKLAGALSFTTPPFLPGELLRWPPIDNWERVAASLAQAVYEGPVVASGSR